MNLVVESLNELHNFKKKLDPLSSLGIGQKAIIIKWLDEMNVTYYTIKDNLVIDVNGDLNLYNKGLNNIPSYIKFDKVNGSFSCSKNKLLSLEGCPETVGSSFDCRNNKKQFSEEEVKKVCKVKGNVYV